MGCPDKGEGIRLLVIGQNVLNRQLVKKIFHPIVRQFSREESHDLLFFQGSNRLQQRNNIVNREFINHCFALLEVSFLLPFGI